MDEETILKSVNKTGCCITAEDHYVNNGLGGAVSQLLSEKRPAPVEFVALREYAESGEPDDLRRKYNISAKEIVSKSLAVINRKSMNPHIRFSNQVRDPSRTSTIDTFPPEHGH